MTLAIPSVFRSLRSFNYRVWVGGAFVSNVGTWVQRTAQAWLVLSGLTDHDASAVGLVMALQFGPQLLLLPWTGFAADYFNQRKLLIVTQTTMGALALALGALTVAGYVQFWHVCVFAFLFGSAAAFDAPVRQTFVAELVGDGDLHNAVALNSTSFNLARMIGPAVAGLVIAAIGTGWAFVINGASFIAVLISLAFLRADELRPNARARRTKGSFSEGLRYVWGRPDLRAILVMLFLIGTFGLNFQIFISTMAVSVFHTDASGYGLLSSSWRSARWRARYWAPAAISQGSACCLSALLCSGSGARWPPSRPAIGSSPARSS
jgi:MFS family permease